MRMRGSVEALIVLVIASCCLPAVLSASEFAAHRMIQFDRGNVQHGSRTTSVNHMAGTLQSSDLSRHVLVVHMEELTPEIVKRIIDGSLSVGGLLIILPVNTSEVSDEARTQWKGYEQAFLKVAVAIPVYFTLKAPAIEDIYGHVLKGSGDGYQLVVSEGEAAPIDPVRGTNIQSWLTGQGGIGGDADNLPTIAIVTHYDTLGIAPGLAVGADDNGSGVVALLELARLFSKLYRRMGTQGKYNIVFVLTGAGRVSFAGTKHWLDRADARLLENIELALCLDALGQGEGVYLHISKPAKDREISKLYEEFRATATRMGIEFDLVHKKIDLQDQEVYWEHEQFSRKRVLAATATHHKQAVSSFEHSSILDREANVETLIRNIKFLGEVLASHIYGYHGQGLEVFKGSLRVDEQFVAAWLSSLSQHARVQPFLQTAPTSTPQGQLIDGLATAMEAHTETVRQDVFTVTSPITFYGVADVRMSAFKVKPVIFDLVFSCIVLAYFVLLFFALQGVGPGMETIRTLMAAKSAGPKYKTK